MEVQVLRVGGFGAVIQSVGEPDDRLRRSYWGSGEGSGDLVGESGTTAGREERDRQGPVEGELSNQRIQPGLADEEV